MDRVHSDVLVAHLRRLGSHHKRAHEHAAGQALEPHGSPVQVPERVTPPADQAANHGR